MKYTGYDKTATAKMEGTERFVQLCSRRWGMTNLGTLVVRQMRSGQGMSVHATGRAADIGFADTKAGRADAVEAMLWFVKYYKELGIEEVHDYGGLINGTWQGWRCNRKGKPGWKLWTDTDNGGSKNGRWIHVELAGKANGGHAENGDALETAWRALPKPAKP
jgi:hypothetical protein